MTFPLTVHGQTFEDGPTFATAVLDDAIVGGGRFVTNQPPHQWVVELCNSASIDRGLISGLTAWLAQTDNVYGIAEAVRIATALSLSEIVPVFAAGLEGYSLELMLQPDPLEPSQSIEDLVLHCMASLMDGSDDALRVKVLMHLRNSGLRHAEAELLLRHGASDELERWLPAIFVESRPDVHLVVPAMLREPATALIVAQCLRAAPMDYRQQIWSIACEKAPLLAQNQPLRNLLLGHV